MMGFGGMGMTLSWLVGGVTIAVIWAGVWWLVASIGRTTGSAHSTIPVPPPAPRSLVTWQQPTFTANDATGATTPTAVPSLSDARAESTSR